MLSSRKSSVLSNIQPKNIFYVWYAELCRRSNSSPLSIVKPAKPKNDTVLDFTADRIKSGEWTPILNALRFDTSLHVIAIRSKVMGYPFMHEINTQDRVRHAKRRSGFLWTDYILKSLIKSLGSCFKITQVLTSLELDGLPLSADYLDLLLQNLRHNNSLKLLSLKHSPIGDCGCQVLCAYLRIMPNIELLNLSSCNLSSISGQHIAGIIKHQQLNRYCESWHNSLRYEDPEVGIMAGLKRITLNNNPNIGDEGLCYILDELDDDLWIKVIDMQKCNITEQISRRLIDVVEGSRSLEIADFRNNADLSNETVEKILEALEKKQSFGNNPEYKWCYTSTTLADFGTASSFRSNIASTAVIQKSQSAPVRKTECFSHCNAKPQLRRGNTVALFDRKPNRLNNLEIFENHRLNEAKERLNKLNKKLQEETLKRKQAEKVNSDLQKKIESIRQLGSIHSTQKTDNHNNLPNIVQKFIEIQQKIQEKYTSCKIAHYKQDANNNNMKLINIGTITDTKHRHSTKSKTVKKNNIEKFYKTISEENMLICKETNTFESVFDQLNGQRHHNHFFYEPDKVDNILHYYYDYESDQDKKLHPVQNTLDLTTFEFKHEDGSDYNSNLSLEKFLEELDNLDGKSPCQISECKTVPKVIVKDSDYHKNYNICKNFIVTVK